MPVAAPRHYRQAALVVGISVVVAATWAYLVWVSMGMLSMSNLDASAFARSARLPWSPTLMLSLFAMWSLMMAAMMLPGAVPAVLLFDRISATRGPIGRFFARPWWFIGGYLGAWCVFSLGATVAQSALHAAVAMSASMALKHPLPGVLLLAAAGAYQLSALKNRCLTTCHSPLDFFTTHWRDGRVGAFVMGTHHGAWCVGCCWLLMAGLFVVGVMNLAWIGGLTVLVVAEKSLPKGQRLAHVSGWLLLGWAAWRAIALL